MVNFFKKEIFSIAKDCLSSIVDHIEYVNELGLYNDEVGDQLLTDDEHESEEDIGIEVLNPEEYFELTQNDADRVLISYKKLDAAGIFALRNRLKDYVAGKAVIVHSVPNAV